MKFAIGRCECEEAALLHGHPRRLQPSRRKRRELAPELLAPAEILDQGSPSSDSRLRFRRRPLRKRSGLLAGDAWEGGALDDTHLGNPPFRLWDDCERTRSGVAAQRQNVPQAVCSTRSTLRCWNWRL